MTQTWIVFPAPAPTDAVEVAVAAGAVGFFVGVPPVWSGLSEEQGWTLPCVVTENEDGVVTSWQPL